MGAFNKNRINLTPDNNGNRESFTLEMVEFKRGVEIYEIDGIEHLDD